MLPAPGRGADTTISNITPLFSSNVAVPTLTKEIYWCVDKAWSEPKETRLCSLQIEQQPTIDGQAVRYIADDSILCQCLLDEYRRVRTWKGRIFSWKRCLGVEFINVYIFSSHFQVFRCPHYDLILNCSLAAYHRIKAEF
jgi:hypothetical protein